MQFNILSISSLVLVASGAVDVQDSYIVKLKGNTRIPMRAHIDTVKSLFRSRTGINEIKAEFNHIGSMYHAKFTQDVVGQVNAMEEVEFVEADSKVSIHSVQTGSTWGLNRISQKHKLNSTDYQYNYKFEGAGVNVYVVDTGIMVDHPEFEGRARFGARFAGSNDHDEDGHGTHCAGTVGSKSYGVAKKANLVAVRVLDEEGSGTIAGVVAGINWVVGNRTTDIPSVISMSLGGGKAPALNSAVESAVANGVIVVVAAGNEEEDACSTSPASSPNAITVGATDKNDVRAYFSNYGRCVDVFAPGVDIISTWNDGKTNSISGTSMATPHVAGLVAYFLSETPGTPEEIAKKVVDLSLKDLIKDAGYGSPNLLVNNDF